MQFDKLFNRKAFLDNYEKEGLFAQDLSEFEDSREILQSLCDEYKAAESATFLSMLEH